MNFEIQGMDALMQNLMNLPLEEDEENKALNAGAKVVKEAVEKEVPVGKSKNKKHKLKSNIKIKRAKDGEAKVHTGKAYHGHILEGGRSAGSKFVTKKGKRQKVTWGPIAPNPFFTRGFEISKPGALNAIADEIKKAKNL